MKNRIQLLGFIYIISFLGFALTVVAKPFDTIAIQKHENKQQEKVSANFTKSAFCFLTFSNNSTRTINTVALVRIKSPIYLGFSIDKISEDVLNIKLNQYLHFSKIFLIRIRKKDIIFPFHYHW